MNKIRILSHLRLYVYKQRTDFYHQKSLGVLVSNDGVSVSYMLSDKFYSKLIPDIFKNFHLENSFHDTYMIYL